MKVAILHNLRPQGYNTAVPDDAFEEYDSCETVAAIGRAEARRNRWTAAALWAIAALLGVLIFMLF